MKNAEPLYLFLSLMALGYILLIAIVAFGPAPH